MTDLRRPYRRRDEDGVDLDARDTERGEQSPFRSEAEPDPRLAAAHGGGERFGGGEGQAGTVALRESGGEDDET
jgi:hypothetical protein